MSIVQVRVNLCTMNAWREERRREKREISSLLSPILEHALIYVRVCLYSSTPSFTHTLSPSLSLSINPLIILNCSLVNRACENCRFIPFRSRLHSRTSRQRDGISPMHCSILSREQTKHDNDLFHLLRRPHTVDMSFSLPTSVNCQHGSRHCY